MFCIDLLTTLSQPQGHLAFRRHSEPVVRTFSPSRFVQQGGILLGQLLVSPPVQIEREFIGGGGLELSGIHIIQILPVGYSVISVIHFNCQRF